MPSANSDPSNVSPSEPLNTGTNVLFQGSTKKLLWLWVGANGLGFAIATPLSFLLSLSPSPFAALSVAGFIVGAITGPLQALVLKRQLPRLKIWQWILANIIGSYLGSWIGLFVFGLVYALVQSINGWSSVFNVVSWLPMMLTFALYGAVIGIVVGAAQLVSLRQHAQKLRPWWVANLLGRTLGWVSASILGLMLPETFGSATFLTTWGVLLGAIGGVVYAGTTAQAMLNLKPQTS
ncbi:hypothetical protein N836_20195 [Leptolyngbya sp. Heron Island J]|uniref:hypothetical protein n=1 Tax=Leptolyngbya sp. Heron Island J TaxID=1385935 RepID=UPI0003B9A7E7|nr:hypothetical protein [Leptolyngbya sp. Heron Island J]ESA33747.1 hypothetical protein N836_20195 [Leptolyngbya sp. Heron Island J]